MQLSEDSETRDVKWPPAAGVGGAVSFLKGGRAAGLEVFRDLCVPSKEGLGGRAHSRPRPQGLWLADPHDPPAPKAVMRPLNVHPAPLCPSSPTALPIGANFPGAR